MKKTRQTTADTPRASRQPSMKWIAGAIYHRVYRRGATGHRPAAGMDARRRHRSRSARQRHRPPGRMHTRRRLIRNRLDVPRRRHLLGKPRQTARPRPPAKSTIHRAGDWRPERTRIPRHQPPADGLADRGQPAFPAARRNPSRPPITRSALTAGGRRKYSSSRLSSRC